MSNPRTDVVRAASRRVRDDPTTDQYDADSLFVARYDAIRAYDAAHPPKCEHGCVIDPPTVRCSECDKSAPPPVGADPPWRDDMKNELHKFGITRGSATEIARAVLRVAVAHLTDDAVVEAAIEVWFTKSDKILLAGYKYRFTEDMRAALAAAGKALLGDGR